MFARRAVQSNNIEGSVAVCRRLGLLQTNYYSCKISSTTSISHMLSLKRVLQAHYDV